MSFFVLFYLEIDRDRLLVQRDSDGRSHVVFCFVYFHHRALDHMERVLMVMNLSLNNFHFVVR